MNWLFDDSIFSPRYMCGAGWSSTLIINSQISDLLICLSYYFISTCLFMVWLKMRPSDINSYILLYFVAFIALCGTTHLNDVLAFYYPMYRYFVFMQMVTGIVSATTAIILPIVASRYLKDYKTFSDRLDHLASQINRLETYIRKKS